MKREIPKERFSELGGLQEVKESLYKVQSICQKLINGEITIEYPGKILLTGPPGTAKTHITMAFAGEIGWSLFELRLSTIISEFLGKTQRNMALIFDEIKRVAIKEREENNRGIVFFMDEFDYLAKDRGDTAETGEMKRLVNVILKEFDELYFSKNFIITFCATNHETMLDKAVWRRFNVVHKINLPNEVEREEILRIFLDNISKNKMKLVNQEIVIKELVPLTENRSGSEIKKIIDEVIVSAIVNNENEIKLEDFVNYILSFDPEAMVDKFSKEESIIPFNLRGYNISGDINSILYEDLLMKYLIQDNFFDRLIQSAIFFDSLDEDIKKLLKTLQFSIFYHPNVLEYLKKLKNRAKNLKVR